ncbi:MAG: hypothetical protein NTW19_02590 [Planctomycetota bacterium]|nr:hypothetical protein [Planctomycetota bacterium]
MLQFIRTVLLVTLITGLLWLYAESEVVKRHEIEVDVRFTPAAGRQLLVQPTEPKRVRVILRSSNAVSADLERRTRAGGMTIEISEDPTTPDGPRRIFLKERLASTPPMADLGLNILEVQPAEIDVDVQRLVTLNMPVAVIADGVTLGNVVTDPATASVTLPASQAGRWDKAKVEARPDPKELAALPLNQPQTITVALRLPDAMRNSRAKLDTPTAKVTLSVRKLTESYVLRSVPVLLLSPPAELERQWVKLDDDQAVLRNVSVTGPSDVIDRIRGEQVRVFAELRLTADDIEKAAGKESASGTVIINLPAGVTVDAPPLPVRYRVLKKG